MNFEERLYERFERFCIMVDSNISEHEAFMESTKGADFRTVLALRDRIQKNKKNNAQKLKMTI
jgi:hypothetical protein